mgnify:FL=1
MDALEKMQADRVRLIFGDRDRLDGTIDDLESTISRDIHKSGRDVKLINQAVMSAESGASDVEKKLCRNIIKTLGSHLFADTQRFREMQRSHLKLLNSTASRDDDFFGGGRAELNGGGGDVEAGMRRRQRGAAGGRGSAGGDGEHAGLIASSQAQAQIGLDDLELDNVEMARIAKNIAELSELFQELADLVTDQGTVLDRIDYNMDLSLDNVTKGAEEIEKAAAAQKRNPAFKCMAILVVLIIIFAFILGLKLYMKHGHRRSVAAPTPNADSSILSKLGDLVPKKNLRA